MIDEARWRTCLHEAAHCWADHYLIGAAIGAVSVRPGEGHAGIVLSDPDDLPPALQLGRHPLYGLDPAERQRADRYLVDLLIGDAAEGLDLVAPLGGFGPPAGDWQPEIRPSLVVALAAQEADPKTDPACRDYWRARDLATALVGEATVGPYLTWIRAEAQQAAHTFAAPIHALASALWREPVIDGRKAAAILEAHERS